MLSAFFFILVWLGILIVGADTLIKGAAALSKRAGVPPLVVGLTVVAFGTSAPELVVNVTAAIKGSTDIAIGNIIGSNIANILLILGISAMIANLKVQKTTTWKEIPFAVLSVIMLFVLWNDAFFAGSDRNVLGLGDGIVLLGFFVIFLYYVYGLAKAHPESLPEEVAEIPEYGYPKASALTAIGLVGLFAGGKLFVEGAIDLARIAGLSEMLIGLTVVAVGTSLPELAASVMAARRGHADLAVGNIVGSNVFNILWILGITAIITPAPFSATANFDLVVCLAATLLMFFFLFIGNRHVLNRWHGIVFFHTYLAYVGYLVIRG